MLVVFEVELIVIAKLPTAKTPRERGRGRGARLPDLEPAAQPTSRGPRADWDRGPPALTRGQARQGTTFSGRTTSGDGTGWREPRSHSPSRVPPTSSADLICRWAHTWGRDRPPHPHQPTALLPPASLRRMSPKVYLGSSSPSTSQSSCCRGRRGSLCLPPPVPAFPDAPPTPPGPSGPNVLSDINTSALRCKGRPRRLRAAPPGYPATCPLLLGTGGLCRETPPSRVNAAAARGSQAARSRVLRRDREGRTRSSGVSVRPNGPGGRRHHAGFSNTLI